MNPQQTKLAIIFMTSLLLIGFNPGLVIKLALPKERHYGSRFYQSSFVLQMSNDPKGCFTPIERTDNKKALMIRGQFWLFYNNLTQMLLNYHTSCYGESRESI